MDIKHINIAATEDRIINYLCNVKASPSKQVIDAFMEYAGEKNEIIYQPQEDCVCDLCEKLRVSIFTEQLLKGMKNFNAIRVPVRINHNFKRREETSLCQEKNPKSKT